jgi:Mg-chelatase subunit ChlD
VPAAGIDVRAAEAAAPPGAPVVTIDATSRPRSEIRVAPPSSIQAGEWDDNANFREFQTWLSNEHLGQHPVDVEVRRFLVVRDVNGRAVPRCRVRVHDSAQRSVTLTTVASGRAVFFPRAEGFTDSELVATATCEESTATARFGVRDADGVVDLRLASGRRLPQERTIDVGFILDTTGSMAEEIAAVKSTVQKVASSLTSPNLRVRIGMVAYRDRGDEYVTKTFPMTRDVESFQREVDRVQAGGGGDTPESMNEGLHAALTKLDWSAQSVGRFAFLIADAPPHLDYAQDYDYAEDVKDAAHRGIQVFTVAASGMDGLGQVVFRQIAQYTNATNLFVLRGGAGPQSTGAGDPRSSCGGTHQNYTSGKLDGLIVAKIRQELRATDFDPLKIAGLYKDENAKPCNERFVATN